jgi:hypothetical protein
MVHLENLMVAHLALKFPPLKTEYSFIKCKISAVTNVFQLQTGSPECLAAARLDLLPMYVRAAREMELDPLNNCGGRLASNSHMLREIKIN